MPRKSRPAAFRSEHELPVAAPYRLDLTVSVLRRFSTNVVDVLTSDGRYVRALGDVRKPLLACITQTRPDALAVTLEGNPAGHEPALVSLRRVLGVDRDLAHFDHAASGIAWLRPLALRMRGVKPPRYPTLWEACVNAIVFQQVSLLAASSIVRRMIIALSPPREHESIELHVFPNLERVLGAKDDLMREVGLSAGKLATLRRVGEALASGALDETQLEAYPSPEALALLCGIKGIGPWTATLILLRGLGRLDVFPANDTSVTRNLITVAGVPYDLERVLKALGSQRGMLYYHLLLARLETRGDVGRASSGCRERAESDRSG